MAQPEIDGALVGGASLDAEVICGNREFLNLNFDLDRRGRTENCTRRTGS